MNVTLSTDLRKQVERELATGRYEQAADLVEQAIWQFLEDRERTRRRRHALRTAGHSNDPAALYEEVLNPEAD